VHKWGASGIVDGPIEAGHDCREDVKQHSRGAISRPGFASQVALKKTRAQGMPGAGRTRSLVCRKGSGAHKR
jgi:hypothetical protein